MQDLVQELKANRLSHQDFYTRARELLGEPLYTRFLQNMKQTQASRSIQPPASSSTTFVFGSGAGPLSTSAQAGEKNIDSAALQDVMQYAGVDLKAEAEMILRDQQQGVFSAAAYSGSAALLEDDARMQPGHFFNPMRLKAILLQAGRQYGLEATPDAIEALARVIVRRLSGMVCKLVKYSRHRSDLARRHYKIKVENDPRKQIWLLEQMLCYVPTAPMSPKTAAIAGPKKETDGANEEAMDESGDKKRQRKMGPDETAIKAKIANLTASAATGLKMKSWMTSSSVSMDDSNSQGGLSNSTASKEDKNMTVSGQEEKRLNLSQAPSASPLTERDLIEKYLGRTVGVKDLIRVLEEEASRGRTSNVLHHLYHYQ